MQWGHEFGRRRQGFHRFEKFPAEEVIFRKMICAPTLAWRKRQAQRWSRSRGRLDTNKAFGISRRISSIWWKKVSTRSRRRVFLSRMLGWRSRIGPAWGIFCMRSCWRFIVVLSAAQVSFTHAQVQVWHGTLKLPTYEEGLPDPNPPFDQFATSRFNYPYTLRTNLTNHRADHEWRAVYLENEYLKCSVLPDIGGHLYTCIDKISGEPMFYANPSIKKANIGYRGAWAAFGVEFNFPVSHNWVSMSPVNFAFGKHEDGSASVTVGNTDRVYGMEWTVELILRPKSTVLEERVTLSNRSDVRHRFYWWNNAGVSAWDDSHIEYPMRFVATHGFTEIHPWPVDQDGVDYSVVRNHTKGPVSMFSYGSRENFMGVWSPHTNTGTAHFADYEEVPARKIWSWGVDAEGLHWRKALSDDNSGYLEVQAGLFRNQETYAFLEPRQVIHFSEYWMPVREIGGISRANLSGVASLIRKDTRLIVGFNANHPIPRATVSIMKGEQQMFRETADLTPERTWMHELPNADSQAKYTVAIQGGSRRSKTSWPKRRR